MAENINRASSDDLSLIPKGDAESGAALDALLQADIIANDPDAAAAAAAAEADAKAKAAAAAAAPQPTPDEIAAKAKADAEAAALVKAKENPNPTLDDTVDGLKAEQDAKDKAAAEKEAADKAAAEAAKGTTPDPFDAIQLPQGTKPKSAESFENLKKLARETATKLTTERDASAAALKAAQDELAKAKAAVEAASSTGLTPEVSAELEDLRKFRLSKDVESDPRFKAFDAAISKNTESVYKKLEAAGLGAETLKAIKDIGGIEVVDWEPILPKLPLATRRFVEATLVENERQKDLKAEALETAKAQGSNYTTEREAHEVKTLTDTANGFLKNLPWTAEKQIPATASETEKAKIEADNSFAREAVGKLKSFLSDRSPARFAELAVGTLIAYRNKADLNTAQARIAAFETEKAAATKELSDKLAAVTAERDKHAADLLAIRRAELPRGGGAGNIVSAPTNIKTGILDTRKADEALDALAAEYAAAQG